MSKESLHNDGLVQLPNGAPSRPARSWRTLLVGAGIATAVALALGLGVGLDLKHHHTHGASPSQSVTLPLIHLDHLVNASQVG